MFDFFVSLTKNIQGGQTLAKRKGFTRMSLRY